MRRLQALLFASTLLCVHLSAAQGDVDAAFSRFWAAPSPGEAAALVDDVARSGVTFDEAYRRLRDGRPYTTQPTGLVEFTNELPNLAPHPYSVFVPSSYDPHKKTPVRVQLHGGVGRERPNGPSAVSEASAFAEQAPDHIFVVPLAWRDAPWWTEDQIINVRRILDRVKRQYNIDENRISLAGLSDGGTGAYYFGMREPDAFASFLPMLGMALVLANDQMGVEGSLFPNNLRYKPFFVVNGGRDPLYPIDRVQLYLDRFKAGGMEIDYRPQPQAGHDRSWWPSLKDPLSAFVQSHPRNPLPDRLTWETLSTRSHNRTDWLVIDTLGSAAGEAKVLDDLNLLQLESAVDFGARGIGARIIQVAAGSNAEEFGLKAFDTLVELNGETVKMASELSDVLADIKPGTTIELLVARNNLPVELKGVYAPKAVVPPPQEFFPHDARSGRVDLVRTGNTIDATTRGVSAFTLLLSPDQFDFDQPVKVVANRRVVFNGRVVKSLVTLMKWAAAENDRTRMFGAELHLDLTK